MKTVCEKDRCAGCMACVDACPVAAISILDNITSYNAIMNEELCVGCGRCQKICPQNSAPILLPPKHWYQGWAKEEHIRQNGSSGGAAAAITKAFIENGGVVCSCVLEDGVFCFATAQTTEEAKRFRGSRYIKSNPEEAYTQMRSLLAEQRKVLFIALPCQIAAAKHVLGKAYEDLFYTIDLICHGTPSPKVLDAFLAQYGKSVTDYRDMQFRKKAKFQLFGNSKGVITDGVTDHYSLAFLNGLCYTENCYQCSYARQERIADITLGDSWGSTLPEYERKKGISLILCQTQKGKELVEMAQMELLNVDMENAVRSNHQLVAPSKKPKERETFFFGLTKGKKFNFLVMRALPKQCFKQEVKKLFIALGLRR